MMVRVLALAAAVPLCAALVPAPAWTARRPLRASLLRRLSTPEPEPATITIDVPGIDAALGFEVSETTSQLATVGSAAVEDAVEASADEGAGPLQLITFDATGTLMRLTEPVGMHYREVLFEATDCRIRLPPPQEFTAAYADAYAETTARQPCFGCGQSVSSRDWWRGVVRTTYETVFAKHNMDVSQLDDELFDEVFEVLYTDVFMSSAGFELVPDALDTLERLREWRDERGGPKLGVISNFDERLPTLLGALGIGDIFDFCLTSRECGQEKPSRQIFDVALMRGDVRVPGDALHVGDRYDRDITGATRAGWRSVLVSPDDANTGAIGETIDAGGFGRVGDLRGILDFLGMETPEDRIIPTTIPRGLHEEKNIDFAS